MDIETLLKDSRKAQLQEFFVRWFPGEKLLGLRDKLMARLGEAMGDSGKVRERFDHLSRSAQDFLTALLSRQDYLGTMGHIRAEPRARSIEDFEIENLVRSLQDEGMISSESQPGPDGGWREVYQIPAELGDALRRTVDIEEREALKMLSLRGLLGEKNGDGLGDLVDAGKVEDRIRGLADEELAGLVRLAIRDYFGVITSSRCQLRGNGDGFGDSQKCPLHRPEWREALEQNHLGTTGVISLRDFGIELEEEGLVVFQELVLQSALSQAREEPDEIDREVCLGVDLLIDLERILEIVHFENVEVTREGTIFKKTEERIGPLLITPGYPELFDGDPVQHLFGMCRRLNFFDQDGSRLRCDPVRRRAWVAKRPLAKLREIYDLQQSENRGEHWSFHQRVIREIFMKLLTTLPPGNWVESRAVFHATLSSFLLSLEENGVDAEFKRRWNEDFQNEKLTVPLDKLFHDLCFWVLHRMALLGLVDLGYREGKFHALKFSQLGAHFFDLPALEEDPEKLIVNPDFEVLLFPGGEREAEWSLIMSRFADRTASDKVKRYQINSESVKRGVISGMNIKAVLKFLRSHAANPIPPNVRYSIREWGEGVESIQRQRTLLLRARSREGAERLAGLLQANGLTCERFSENRILVPAAKGERVLRQLRDELHDQGLYLE